jgi:hypothetical protein
MNDSIADAVAATLAPPGSQVTVNPAIPEHIAKNILIFLARVKSEGTEAFAWVEAVQYLQQFVPKPSGPGVPFGGLPPS